MFLTADNVCCMEHFDDFVRRQGEIMASMRAGRKFYDFTQAPNTKSLHFSVCYGTSLQAMFSGQSDIAMKMARTVDAMLSPGDESR